MSAPFILKIKYSFGSKSRPGDAAHMKYIASRPGTVKEIGDFSRLSDDEAERELERELGADDEKYSSYIAEREGSHGLFGADQDKIPDLEEVKKELLEHEGIVWRAILSVKEEDAVRIGYESRESWEKLLRSQMNTAAEKMGIERSNLRWVAAFHEAKGHPHVHVMFWEKNPQRTVGKLGREELREIKKVFAGEIFREERLRQMQEKALIRDYIREHALGSISRAKEIVREFRKAQKEAGQDMRAWAGTDRTSISPLLDENRERELAEKLHSLSLVMPGKGRAALKFMPENVKQEARSIADWMLKQPHFRQQVEKYEEAAGQLAGIYTKDPAKLKEAGEKAYNDIRDRVANIIVRSAAGLNKYDRIPELDKTKAEKAFEKLAQAADPVEDRTAQLTAERAAAVLKGVQGIDNNKEIFAKKFESEQIYDAAEAVQADVRQTAAVLHYCGLSNDRIKEILQEQKQEPKALQEKDVGAELEKYEFEQMLINFNIVIKDEDHPWQPVAAVDHEICNKAVEIFRSAGCESGQEGWTAFVMYAALKQMGVEIEERVGVLREWIDNNNLAGKIDLNRIVSRLEEGDILSDTGKLLRETTWKRLVSNLGCEEIQYPWTVQGIEFNSDKAAELISKFDRVKIYANHECAAWTVNAYARFLGMTGLEIEHAADKAQQVLTDDPAAVPKPVKYTEKEIEKAVQSAEKKVDGFERLRSVLKVQDDMQRFLTQYAKALFVINPALTKEQAQKLIEDFVQRSGTRVVRDTELQGADPAELAKQKIEKAIEKAWEEKHYYSYIPKAQWQELCDRLGTDIEVPWKSFSRMAPSYANICWRSVWKAVERERVQAEAQAEFQKRRMAAKEQIKREMEQKYGREYFEKER